MNADGGFIPALEWNGNLGRMEERQVWNSAEEDAGQTQNSGCVLVLPCIVRERFYY